MKFSKHLYALAIAGAALNVQAQSISNINPASSTVTVNGALSISQNSTIANWFSFQAGSNFSISDISLALTAQSPKTGTLRLSLCTVDSSGNLPVEISGAFSTLNYSVAGTSYTANILNYTSSDLGSGITSQTLVAGQKYAIGLSVSSPASPTLYWGTFSSPSYSASNLTYLKSGGITNTDGYGIAITGAAPSPVPEASGSVAGIGLAMAGLYQLRRRKAAVGKLSVEG
jgi:hypothetical protein